MEIITSAGPRFPTVQKGCLEIMNRMGYIGDLKIIEIIKKACFGMNYIELKKYGLTESTLKEASLHPDLFPARVTEQHRDIYTVVSEKGELQAEVTGRMMFQTDGPASFPAVGDWVMIDRTTDEHGRAMIHHVLSRKSVFRRITSGTSNESQIVAANIDTVFICMSLNADFNLRRLERYLSIVWDSSAIPVIVLTKSDLCEDIPGRLSDISTVSVGADVVICSSLNENGLSQILPHVKEGKTIAFLGSSGVGKSTLINRLMGKEILETQGIRENEKGRHTTTFRQLLLLPEGGIVIDTPGMRELHLESGNLERTFEDIAELESQCRFADCSHTSEPHCAVLAAVESGIIGRERLESYRKLQKELGYEGLNSQQLEKEKIKRMFGSMGEMKQAMKYAKNKNKW
jgi:ribosome biogenesis GTPase